jgi:outer membrane receptor protein involved in Fe transport
MKSLVALFLLITTFTFAQTFSIKGSLTNASNEPNLNVSLLEFPSQKLIKIAVVSPEKSFQFKSIANGDYQIKISGVTINEVISEKIVVQNQDAVLLPISIFKKENQLSELKIVVQKPMVEVMPDKTVFNVQSSVSSAGLTAFEVLRKAPGVLIDNNDGIIVEGKSGVQIYIDGKPSILTGTDLTNYLKTIQSSDVDNVEIITQPSSKYEAAGTAGILNIKLKRDKRFGTNGTATAGYAIARYAKYNTGLTLNSRTKKFNLFGTYSNRFDNTYSFINLNRRQSNTIFDSRTTNVNQNNANNIKAGFDFFKNKKNTFGMVLNGNFNNSFVNADTRTPITTVGNSNPSQVLIAENNTKSLSYNVQSNANYRYVNDSGQTVSVDADFGKYQNLQSTFQPNSYFNGNETQIVQQVNFLMRTPINIQILSLKADYEQNLMKGKLGLGFKTSVVNTNNVFDFFDFSNGQPIQNFTRSNTFKFEENINALYFNYNKTIKKFGYQIGVRAEQTVSTGDLISTQTNLNNKVKRNYTDFFPSAGVTYNPNQNNSWQLNYSKRIERPGYQSLNPFEMQIDELTFRRGNPFLQPQYINNFKVAHIYKYKLSTSLSYSYISDFFAQITQAEGATRNFIMQRNVANQEVWNLGISYPFSPTKWWDVYANVQASNSAYQGNDANFVSITQNNFNLYGQNTFSLPKKIKFEVSGWFSSPSVWGGTYRTKSLGSLDLAIQKKVWKDKINVRMTLSDVFFTSPWRGDFAFGDLEIRGNGGQESRQFRINLSYVFGNSNVKATQRKTGTEDENQRI